MSETKKGSALPRGLSSSDKVYLSPGRNMDCSCFNLGVRRSNGVVEFYKTAPRELDKWLRQESFFEISVRLQLENIHRAADQTMVWGLPNPAIMGIVNVTPDSFSDGGYFFETDHALKQASALLKDGAHILDIGGESTRPGADAVCDEDEIARVLPVLNVCRDWDVSVSVDTRKSSVMKAALAEKIDIINDVSAFEFDKDSLQVAVGSDAKVCLMHSAADPKVMQDNPEYDHVLFDVIDYLKARIDLCEEAGIDRSRIAVDPGIGFGKTLDHNLTLLKGLSYLHALGCPILLGVSRKSFIEKIDPSGDAKNRIGGSISALLSGLSAGVQIFRVHDVAETRQAISIWSAIEKNTLSI